jgi:hypothetical protein
MNRSHFFVFALSIILHPAFAQCDPETQADSGQVSASSDTNKTFQKFEVPHEHQSDGQLWTLAELYEMIERVNEDLDRMHLVEQNNHTEISQIIMQKKQKLLDILHQVRASMNLPPESEPLLTRGQKKFLWATATVVTTAGLTILAIASYDLTDGVHAPTTEQLKKNINLFCSLFS